MNVVTICIGAIIAAYGLFTFYSRINSPEKFGKLQAMKDKFGSGKGTTIHIIAYSILPLVLGGMVVYAGINGLSIMQLIAT